MVQGESMKKGGSKEPPLQKKQPPVIGSLPLYFYVNIYGYLIMQPSPPLLHLLRQGQACTQALSP